MYVRSVLVALSFTTGGHAFGLFPPLGFFGQPGLFKPPGLLGTPNPFKPPGLFGPPRLFSPPGILKPPGLFGLPELLGPPALLGTLGFLLPGLSQILLDNTPPPGDGSLPQLPEQPPQPEAATPGPMDIETSSTVDASKTSQRLSPSSKDTNTVASQFTSGVSNAPSASTSSSVSQPKATTEKGTAQLAQKSAGYSTGNAPMVAETPEMASHPIIDAVTVSLPTHYEGSA